MGRLLGSVNAVVSRTGYTGEDGFELIVGSSGRCASLGGTPRIGQAPWHHRRAAWVPETRCGSRPAMPLYGHELSESIDPFSAGLGWAVKLDKGDFVGREALERFKGQRRPKRGRARARRQADRPARLGRVFSGDTRGRRRSPRGRFRRPCKSSLAMALRRSRRGRDRHARSTVDVRGHREPARSSSCRSTNVHDRPRPAA